MDEGCGVGAIMVQLDEVGFTPHGGVWWSGKVGVLAYRCTCGGGRVGRRRRGYAAVRALGPRQQ